MMAGAPDSMGRFCTGLKLSTIYSHNLGEKFQLRHRSVKVPRKRSSILVPMPSQNNWSTPAPEPRTFSRFYITERQLEILSWVQHGKSARDIGAILGISPRTVEHQLEKVCENLGVRTRFQAVLKVRDLGVLDQPL
jgi:DNA-binding CsgD family transcriptional regulator